MIDLTVLLEKSGLGDASVASNSGTAPRYHHT
jgi:hypothetical protein